MKVKNAIRLLLGLCSVGLLQLSCNTTYQLSKGFANISADTTMVSVPFYAGLNGYAAFRIPSVVKTKKTILAFAEGRKNSSSDYGDIDVVCRRSLDGGKSWEALQIIHSNGDLVAQNPVPIYDAQNDKVVLLFNTAAISEHAILHTDYDPKEGRRAFVTETIDEGLHWENPREITQSVKRPYWRWFALGPVHGIQLQEAGNRGRLVVPVATSIAKGGTAYCMAMLYSDDYGKHWVIGAEDENLSDVVRANETTIVELSDGRIYVNTRDHTGGSALKNRGETYSLDGGESFDGTLVESDKFPSPIVQSSVLRWRSKQDKGGTVLLFSTPSNPSKREHLIVMANFDESKTWQKVFQVHKGFSAYSDMVKINATTLGVLYETDNYTKIRFRRIRMK